METVNIHEAKTHLSRLIAKAAAGEDVVIAKAGKPVVRLTALTESPKPLRRLGTLEGLIKVPDDVKTPFAEEIEEMFYGNPDKFKNL